MVPVLYAENTYDLNCTAIGSILHSIALSCARIRSDCSKLIGCTDNMPFVASGVNLKSEGVIHFYAGAISGLLPRHLENIFKISCLSEILQFTADHDSPDSHCCLPLLAECRHKVCC